MSDRKEQIAEDKLDVFSISWIAIACCIAVAVISMYGVSLYFRTQTHENRVKAAQASYPELRQLTNEQLEELNSTGWADRERELVRIPIQDAMRLVVRRSAAGVPLLPPAPVIEQPAAEPESAVEEVPEEPAPEGEDHE